MELVKLNRCFGEVKSFHTCGVVEVSAIAGNSKDKILEIYNNLSKSEKRSKGKIIASLIEPSKYRESTTVILAIILGVCTLHIGLKLPGKVLGMIGRLFRGNLVAKAIFLLFQMGALFPILFSMPVIHMYATYLIVKCGTEQLSILHNRAELKGLVKEKKALTDALVKKLRETQDQQEDSDIKEAYQLLITYLEDKLKLYNTLVPDTATS